MWKTLPRSDNGKIAWYETGSGCPIVFVHGVGLRAESWHAQIQHFGLFNRVYALDMPGHGNSKRIASPTPTLDIFAQCLLEFMQGVVGEAAIVVGHSMGAMLALDFAAKHPNLCKGVVALNAIYRRAPVAMSAVQARASKLLEKGADKLASDTVRRWFGDAPEGHLKQLAELCRQWLQQADRRGYADAFQVFANEDGPETHRLARMLTPALFVTGSTDLNSTPDMSVAMAKLAPRGDPCVIAGAGHMVQMTHPRNVNQALAEFIARCQPQFGPQQGIVNVS